SHGDIISEQLWGDIITEQRHLDDENLDVKRLIKYHIGVYSGMVAHYVFISLILTFHWRF
ncbi:hypothetical protein, partial [Paenibacillus abyssi]|uniref:hypothetical protein n=1 Tax=Paenibacillus abyssi TaxID=1340531 RepID=UPI001E36F99D